MSLLPKDRQGWRLCALLFIIPVGVYVDRYVFSVSGNEGPLGCLAVAFLPCVLGPFVVALTYIVRAVAYARKHKNPVLPALFIVLFAVSNYLPLPPLPYGKDAQHFFAHRAEYEQVVDLARNSQPIPEKEWNARVEKRSPLVVMFNPLDFYGIIAYAEKREDLDATDGCHQDGYVWAQLDKTWWLCFREWN